MLMENVRCRCLGTMARGQPEDISARPQAEAGPLGSNATSSHLIYCTPSP